uniref:Uncharacterized protein n=1 Tax=Panagrolaimus sp. PS1159 TaxID=55785 RepID=A0AC35FQG9_9BILA
MSLCDAGAGGGEEDGDGARLENLDANRSGFGGHSRHDACDAGAGGGEEDGDGTRLEDLDANRSGFGGHGRHDAVRV